VSPQAWLDLTVDAAFIPARADEVMN